MKFPQQTNKKINLEKTVKNSYWVLLVPCHAADVATLGETARVGPEPVQIGPQLGQGHLVGGRRGWGLGRGQGRGGREVGGGGRNLALSFIHVWFVNLKV